MSLQSTHNDLYLGPVSDFLALLQAQHQEAGAIATDIQTDNVLNESFKSDLASNYESIFEQVFDTSEENYELPVINSLKEEFFDAIAAYKRHSDMYEFDRAHYYAKSLEEYDKYNQKLDYIHNIQRHYLERHIEAFS